MQITVKIKYGAAKQRVETFGNNRYIVYLSSDQADADAEEELKALLSKSAAIPPNKLLFQKKTAVGDYVFEC